MEPVPEHVANQLFFDDRHLFGHYRERGLESVASLYTKTSTTKRRRQPVAPQAPVVTTPPTVQPVQPTQPVEPPVETMDVEVDTVPSPVEEAVDAAVAAPPPDLLVTQPPSGAVVFSLFPYLSDEMVARLLPDPLGIERVIHDRCHHLLRDVEKRRSQIASMQRAFICRLLLEMLAMDERGHRFGQMLARFEELYLLWEDEAVVQARQRAGTDAQQRRTAIERAFVRGGKNNATNVDRLHTLALETYALTQTPERDKWAEKCANAKQRGRKPRAEKEHEPHPIDRIRASQIESLRTMPPVVYNEQDRQCYLAFAPPKDAVVANSQLKVDYYPLCVKVLDVFCQGLPRDTNHGWFTARLRRAARCLTPRQWPMHGLVQSLINLEGVVERTRVRLQLRQPTDRYYCCYSGLPLQDGEEVWRMRLLVLSPARHQKWVVEGERPMAPHLAPELERSVRVYYMKSRVTSVTSLFYTDFPDHYRRQHGAYFSARESRLLTVTTSAPPPRGSASSSARQLPVNRRYTCNSLWTLLNRLKRFVEENRMRTMLWDRDSRESYDVYAARTLNLLALLQDEAFETQFLYYLFTSLFGVSVAEELPVTAQQQPQQVRDYLEMTLDVVLDFVDLMFDFLPPGHAAATTERVSNATFALPSLGVANNSDERPNQQLVVKPLLLCGAAESPVLRNLFLLSDRRQSERVGTMDYGERRQRLQRVESMVCHHAFLFMVLYDALYLSSPELTLLSFTEAMHHLSCMGISLHSRK